MIEWIYRPASAPRDGSYVYVLLPGRQIVYLVRYDTDGDPYFPWVTASGEILLGVNSFVAWRPKGVGHN